MWRTLFSGGGHRASARSVLPPFLAAFIVLALAYTAIFVGRLHTQQALDSVEVNAAESARVDLAASSLESSIDTAASDARVAVASRAVRSLAEEISAGTLSSAASVFQAQVSNKPAIRQIRYIDETGRERLAVRRTDDGVQRVPTARLQDRSKHYFFAETRDLRPGDTYVTRLDLEVDASGAIVEPRQPLMRVIAALGDSTGARAGSVIVDIDGFHLVEQARQVIGAEGYLLLNATGGYIGGPDEADSFGFMTDGPAFAERHPEAWQTISASDSGHAMAHEGLYAFSTAHPEHAQTRLSGETHDADTHGHPNALKVVSFVTAAALPSASITRDTATTAIFVFGLIALATVTGLATHTLISKRQYRRSIREAKTRLEAIRDTLGEGLVVIDPDGRITDVNPESERMLGWTREQMLGRVAHELFHSHPDHSVEQVECAMLAVARTGVTFRSEDEVFQRADGNAIHVGVSAAPLVVDEQIEGAVIVFRDTTEIREYQEEIRRLAFHDALTGLPNRRVLADRLDLAISTADRRLTPLAVMFLDLDGFKEVNDDYGHAVGDEFLRQISDRLCGCLRSSDTLARQGGDEFIVLLPELHDEGEAEVVARRIIDGLEQPFVVDGYQLRAAVSVGIAVRLDGESAETLIANADDAMYAAKQMGENLYCVSGRAPVAQA
ncbi:diguanylate cyclase [Salinibacterium sp. dk2585]|uniref:diguanylate cyclase domain-containing protein n=1 Tax=unclassified Salinibacterium TaxID=2632331 RepID=UPI0011C25197|nr:MULTISPECIES: diguanylate cyclase [unclassified Salinibacterium]QEE62121.1 diguanylate cyclase [Salinibacterium sp. dk2585]TXK53473.1 diguanylate cyclase [Salinibacterium sp. dk5596]